MPSAAFRLTAAVAALALATPALPNEATAELPAGHVKWHPGHYVTLVNPGLDDSAYASEVIAELKRQPLIRGVQVRYTWHELERREGEYDFAAIERHLAMLSAIDRRLFVLLQTKTFDSRTPAVPDYLRSPKYESGAFVLGSVNSERRQHKRKAGEGENVVLWNDLVRDRMIALAEALGRRFNAHPNFEGVALSETAIGRPLGKSRLDEQRVRRYFENLLAVNRRLAAAFPNTVVVQFTNYPWSVLPWFIDGLRGAGVGLGGPNVYQDDPGLLSGVYPYYKSLAGVLPLAPSVQHDGYKTRRAGARTGNQSVQDLYGFARVELHANYLFWTRRVYGADRPYMDVLALLDAMDATKSPSGGLHSACPRIYRACVGT